jgi:hypothetical protein
MKSGNLRRRLEQLEQRGGRNGQPKLRFILSAGPLALSEERCVEILDESGYPQSETGVSLIMLNKIPPGLNVAELEKYLRNMGKSAGMSMPSDRPSTRKENRCNT